MDDLTLVMCVVWSSLVWPWHRWICHDQATGRGGPTVPTVHHRAAEEHTGAGRGCEGQWKARVGESRGSPLPEQHGPPPGKPPRPDGPITRSFPDHGRVTHPHTHTRCHHLLLLLPPTTDNTTTAIQHHCHATASPPHRPPLDQRGSSLTKRTTPTTPRSSVAILPTSPGSGTSISALHYDA